MIILKFLTAIFGFLATFVGLMNRIIDYRKQKKKPKKLN